MSLLKTIAADLVEFVSGGIAPIYVLDDDRRIVYCNTACARWAGTKVSDLIGQQCAFHTPDERDGPAAVAAGLVSAAEGVLRPSQNRAQLAAARPDGSVVHRQGHFFPLGRRPGRELAGPGDSRSPRRRAFARAGRRRPGRRSSPELQLHEHVRRFRLLMAGRFHADSLLGNHPWIVRARAQIELAAQNASQRAVHRSAGRRQGTRRQGDSLHSARERPFRAAVVRGVGAEFAARLAAFAVAEALGHNEPGRDVAVGGRGPIARRGPGRVGRPVAIRHALRCASSPRPTNRWPS